MDLTTTQYVVLLYAGLVYGLAKIGITGLTALLVPMLLAFFTPGQALGLALPILIFTDILTVVILRRSVNWRKVFLALPWALAGIFAGWRILAFAQTRTDGDVMLKRLIAVFLVFIVVSGVLLRIRQSVKKNGDGGASAPDASAKGKIPLPTYIFASSVATVGGVVTMLANNSGPAWVVYLMLFRLDKYYFLGTVAWLVFILNLTKLPLVIQLGYVTPETIQVNAIMVPTVLAGLYFGRRILTWIPQRVFDNAVQALALLGALYLLFLAK